MVKGLVDALRCAITTLTNQSGGTIGGESGGNLRRRGRRGRVEHWDDNDTDQQRSDSRRRRRQRLLRRRGRRGRVERWDDHDTDQHRPDRRWRQQHQQQLRLPRLRGRQGRPQPSLAQRQCAYASTHPREWLGCGRLISCAVNPRPSGRKSIMSERKGFRSPHTLHFCGGCRVAPRSPVNQHPKAF